MEPKHQPDNILDFKPKTDTPNFAEALATGHTLAVVTQLQGTLPYTVEINGTQHPVTGCLTPMPGIAPGFNIGDKVVVSPLGEGVLIHGAIMDTQSEVKASLRMIEGRLIIEAQGALTLQSGASTLELNEAGEIRIDGKSVRTHGEDVRTVAHESLTLLGGKVELN